eukprot:4290332-Karenia_brevis.AAC.1
MIKGELTPVGPDSEMHHMLIQIPAQIVVEGFEEEPWDMSAIFEMATLAANKIEGYPWIICVEQVEDVVGPLN